MPRSSLLLLMAVALPVERTDAQSTVGFRNYSSITARIRFEVQGTLVVVGVTGETDSTRGEYEAFVEETRVVSNPIGGNVTMRSVFDSSRVRHRSGKDHPWRVLRTPSGSVGPVSYVRDPTLGLSPVDGSLSGWVQTVRGIAGNPEFSLPDSVLENGRRWTGFLELPYTVGLPDDSATVISLQLDGRASFVLDSIVVRPSDTLAYIQVNAGLSPRRAERPYLTGSEQRTVTIWGTVNTAMVWSTGWAQWVTGVTSLKMQHRVEPGPDSTNEITIFADLTSRFSIRP